jgi:hypothetical protein
MIQLDTLILPDDLFWIDEFGWSPVASSFEYTTTGAGILEVSSKQTGRPITLGAESDEHCWVTRAEVLALKALADVAGKEMALTLYDRNFTTFFAPKVKPFDVSPVWKEMPVEDGDRWVLKKIRLIAV